MTCLFRATALCSFVVTSMAALAEKNVLEQWHLDAPLWSGTIVYGESLFFLEPEPGALPTASLLFLPTEIKDVVDPSTGHHFEEGRDYTWDKATKTLVLTADSRIPSMTYEGFRPPVGGSGQLYKDKSRDIFFENEHRFHDIQVEITYTHSGTEWATWKTPVPPSAVDGMPQLMKKLQAKEPVTVCLLGDSISAGLNASGDVGVAPHMPSYGGLVAQGLEAHFGSKINYTNFSVSGMSTPWAIEQSPKVGALKPDLVLIAFGMNDASGKLAPERYAENIAKIMAGVREEQPECTFVLVATMEGNADWLHTQPELYPKYRDALATLCGPEVILADMTSIWHELMNHKKFADITGNGVNHPNDFTHRVYAQVLLALFGM